jgi:hypothetical protein
MYVCGVLADALARSKAKPPVVVSHLGHLPSDNPCWPVRLAVAPPICILNIHLVSLHASTTKLVPAGMWNLAMMRVVGADCGKPL